MEVYSWDIVQATILSQAEVAGTPIPESFFERNNFFSPEGLGCELTFFEGTSANGVFELLVSSNDAKKLAEYVSQEYLGTSGRLTLSGITPHVYTTITPCTIRTPQQYTKALQKVKKRNKANERLRDAIAMWKNAADLINSKRYVFISFDIEVYEMDHKILLELGWSMFDSQTNRYMDQHYINNSYRHLSNGRFVDDQKLKFMFGVSVWASLDQALTEFRKDLDWCVRRDGGYILVGHGLENDIKFLAMQKFKWPGAGGRGSHTDVNRSAVTASLDTETLYGAYSNCLHNPPSLGRSMDSLNLDSWCLHNAGN
ncbi:hypothetical protein INT44_002154 [Umbelopsis vinacea]|uniref:Gfd2/YDR514C-like C-terminal domain-containing protein n=1 Tax=Umbelopsis vinacea TaxID=44442 RepID=A0A8H7UMM6_9FUNG|nr:hypothetical protein INT44_002154 [Umbelopsis vinacea]